jgi:ADP-heptose:LPS heptosyltransferase
MKEQRIAVMKFSALGDIARTLPFLRQTGPETCIITSPLGKAFLEDEFSDFIVLPNKSYISQFRLIQEIRKRRFDHLIDLQGNDRCRFFTKIVERTSCTEVHNGYDANSKHRPFSELAIKVWTAAKAKQIFEPKPREYIVLNCGSSAKWAAKRPPAWKWVEFASSLQDRYDLPFKLTGSADELDLVNNIAKELPGDVEVLAGQTSLAGLKPILKSAFLVVSTDSAAMHIAAAEKTPVIGIFGSTSTTYLPNYPWCQALYDPIYYPDGQLPKCTDKVDGYYDHINLEEGLIALQAYLPS